MLNTGWFLYIPGALFVLLFWSRSRGLTFEELLKRSVHEHECMQRIFARHPHGGSWGKFKEWQKEVDD